MPKTILSFRVESRLLAQFINAAMKANRAPTEVLLEFVREYVSEIRSRGVVGAAGPLLDIDEANNTKIIDFALAVDRIRLLHAQKEGERMASRFLDGETHPL